MSDSPISIHPGYGASHGSARAFNAGLVLRKSWLEASGLVHSQGGSMSVRLRSTLHGPDIDPAGGPVSKPGCLSTASDHPGPIKPSCHTSGRTQRPVTFLITRSPRDHGTGTESQPPVALDELAGPARARGAVSSQDASAPRQSAPKKRAKCRYFASKKGR